MKPQVRPLLQVENLSVHFRAVKALSGVDLAVEPGQCVVLLGPNGSGKSTLLRAVAGLAPVRAGQIKFLGHAIETLPVFQRARRGLAWAPDRGRVAADMTVRDNLLTGAYMCTDAKEVQRRLAEILERFPRLAGFQNRLAGDLSGGQRQLLVIARALMAAPKLLLVDEPFTSLSGDVQNEIIEVMNFVKSQGLGLLLAEHQLEAVLQVADVIYALRNGHVVYHGTKEQFMQDDPLGTIYFDQVVADY